jgi:hypothetical protein
VRTFVTADKEAGTYRGSLRRYYFHQRLSRAPIGACHVHINCRRKLGHAWVCFWHKANITISEPPFKFHSCNCRPWFRVVSQEQRRAVIMRTLGKIAATLGVVGVIAASSTVPAAAWYHHHYYHHRHYGYHHHYYHHRYYGYYPRYHHHHHYAWYRY